MNRYESMQHTAASFHPRVKEANLIAKNEAVVVLEEARKQGNAMIYEAAQDFIFPSYRKPKGYPRTR